MECKHEFTSTTYIDVWVQDASGSWYARDAEMLTCLDCGAWLSLGPANDTPDALVELRAAEIAAAWADDPASIERTLLDEHVGFCEYKCHHLGIEMVTAAHHAGWLARAIVQHDAEQEGGG